MGTVNNSYVERKEASKTNDGKKKFIPYSLTEDGKWESKAWPDNRCLYNEHLLKQYPDKPVLISEGEKAAVYGKDNYKDYVHVSFQGGSKAPDKTNYQHLKDREVILFPDADDAGIRAMVQVAKILIEKEITYNIKIVDVEDLPDKFDIADAPMHQEINVPGYMLRQMNLIQTNIQSNGKKYKKQKIKKAVESEVEISKNVHLHKICNVIL